MQERPRSAIVAQLRGSNMTPLRTAGKKSGHQVSAARKRKGRLSAALVLDG
jgi:hypothetical protein